VQTPLDLEAAQCSTACERDGTPCESSSECCPDTGGSACRAWSCTKDEECPFGTCVTSACTKDADCPGSACDKPSGFCKLFTRTTQNNILQSNGFCKLDCTQASDCPAGASCTTNHTCVKGCRQDSDCPKGACGRDGTCTWLVCAQAACESSTNAACNSVTQGSDCLAGVCGVPPPSLGKAFTPGGLGSNNALTMNLEDPRAHVADQNWTVTFEGALPGFAQRVAYLTLTGATPTLTDPDSRFCDSGVLGQNAVAWMLAEQQKPDLAAAGLGASQLADYVQITSDLPNPQDPYWTQGMPPPGMASGPPGICRDPTNPTTCACLPPSNPHSTPGCSCTDPNAASNDASTCACKKPDTCKPLACDYSTCEGVFGTIDVPALDPHRDLLITEAFEDHLELVPRGGSTVQLPGTQVVELLPLMKCCFPTVLTFAVRAGNQWVVVGDQAGLLHHVIATEATLSGNPPTPFGACRNSCDATLARRNARLVESDPALDPIAIPDRPPGTIDPSPSFLNPMFRFGIFRGKQKCTLDSDCPVGTACDCPGTACSQGICATKVPDATACTQDPMTMALTCSAPSRCDTLACKANGDCASNACKHTTCTQASDCPGGACMNGSCVVGTCQPSCFHYGKPVTVPTPRDSVFRFSTNGSFAPLLVSLSADPAALVEPQSIVYSPATAELAVTDGAFSGLIFVSLTTPGVSRSFF
jgi:hypothetical protein